MSLRLRGQRLNSLTSPVLVVRKERLRIPMIVPALSLVVSPLKEALPEMARLRPLMPAGRLVAQSSMRVAK